MRLEGRRVFRPRRRVQRESSLSTFDRNSLPTRFLRSENVSNGFVRSFDDAIAGPRKRNRKSEVFLTGACVIQEDVAALSFLLSFCPLFCAFFLVLLQKNSSFFCFFSRRVKRKVREKVPPSSFLLPPSSSFLPRW